MGTKGRVFEYRDERDEDFICAFRRQMNMACYPFSLMDVLEKVVDSPSKRFWVSPGRALSVITEIMNNMPLKGMTVNKRRMYMEIYCRVRQLQRQPQYHNEPLSTLIHIVIEQQAPSFYMTPKSAAVIMHHIKKRRRICNRGLIRRQ